MPLETDNSPQKKNLVFSSVGDRSAHKHWIEGSERNFDLCLYYYGEDAGDKHAEDADIYLKRKGTKSKNFFHFYQNNPVQIAAYENYFIVDDDIVIDAEALNQMFDVFDKFNLLAAQPAYADGSQTTWEIARQNKDCILRFTSFVEIGVLIIKQEALHKIIKPFSDSITTWGLDFLVSELLGEPQDKIAILDCITCVHPPRQGQSELDKVLPRKQHMAEGKAVVQKYSNKQVFKMQEYGRILKPGL